MKNEQGFSFFPQTCDVLVFNIQAAQFRESGAFTNLVLVKRKNDPFKGDWAIPGGFMNEGESIPECAARELEEETGYCSDDLTRILSLKTTVAFCDEFIDVYLAKNLKPGHQHLDEGEFIDVAAYEVDELCDMIYAGTIQDAKTVAGILAYKNLLNQD